jgi:hypothetical protein
MGRACSPTTTGEKRNAYMILVEKSDWKNHYDLYVGRRVILKWVIEK